MSRRHSRSCQLGAATRTNIRRFRDFRLGHPDRLGEHPARRADDVVSATLILAQKDMIKLRLRDSADLECVIRCRPAEVGLWALRPFMTLPQVKCHWLVEST